jgi:hypothetical protein
MASIEQLTTALQNADAAGDVDAAKIFAAEITKMRQPSEGNAVTDIVPEIKGAFNENLTAFKQGFGLEGPRPGERGAVEGIMGVGKGLASIPGMMFSPVTGLSRSVGGHALAGATQLAGSFIDQERVRNEDYKDVYEQSKAGVDQAMMAAAPRGASPKGINLIDQTPTAPQLKKAAVDVWESPATKSINIPPNDVVNMAGGLQNDLLKKGFRPTPGSAPETFSELQRLTPDPRVAAVGVDDMRAARRAFGETAKKVDEKGAPTSDASAASRAINKIDDLLDAISPELREANANYAAGSRAETLDYRTMKADRNAAKSGSGMNMENTMRQAVDKIGDRGLSKQEIAARDRIVLGSAPRNALRTTGKLGVDGGLSMMLHAGASLGSGGMTLPITAAGTLARKIGETLTRTEIAALNRSIRSRSPLAKALASKPQFAKIPKGAKAIAAALLTQGSQRPAFAGILPAYADEDKR